HAERSPGSKALLQRRRIPLELLLNLVEAFSRMDVRAVGELEKAVRTDPHRARSRFCSSSRFNSSDITHGVRFARRSRLSVPQDFDGVSVDVVIDIVDFDATSNALEQHDGELSAQVLAEDLESPEEATWMVHLIDVLIKLRNVDVEPDLLEQLDGAFPFGCAE